MTLTTALERSNPLLPVVFSDILFPGIAVAAEVASLPTAPVGDQCARRANRLDKPALRRHDSRPYLLCNPTFSRSSTVANSPSAKKRAIQAEKRRSHNASLRSMVRTYIKNVVKALEAKDLEKARTAYTAAVPVIDRMADKGIIHKNKAARHKSRLNAHIKALSTAA